LWKRIAAWMFDFILTGMLAVGVGVLLSAVLGYDGYSEQLSNLYSRYETEYGVVFQIPQEEYSAMTEEARQNYDNAYRALVADSDVIYVYNMVMNLTLIITTLGILFGAVITEFVLPLFLGNGQTVGKKIFGICLMRVDCVRINTMQLFVRAVLGKYTIETMIPVYLALMVFFGTIGSFGTLLLLGFAFVQILVPAVTRNRSALHDLLAGTVVVDVASQMIFRDTQDLIDYKKKLSREQSNRQDY
jgi:uncharacterized RDD family membrane protein YckC